MLRYAIGLVALVTVFSSCSTDFDLAGEYEEKALVYGLLDPLNNPTPSLNPEGIIGEGHLFRIQKAFLGEESAFIMALNPDSSYFPYERLVVELVEYGGATETGRWELDTIVITNKDTGDPSDGVIDFFGPEQRLYWTDANINPSRTYEVTLKDVPVGADSDTIEPLADATTSIVNTESFEWGTPNENSPILPGTTRKLDLFNTSGVYKDYTIRFDRAEQTRQYEIWMRFYYREVEQGVETEKSIEWKVETKNTENLGSSPQIIVKSSTVYSIIGSRLEVDPNITRYIGLQENSANDFFGGDNHTYDFDFFIRLAGEELFEYIDINNPSNSGALQDKPVYTNINNGLGVFSSRSEVEFRGLFLSETAASHLVGGEFTQGLNFVND